MNNLVKKGIQALGKQLSLTGERLTRLASDTSSIHSVNSELDVFLTEGYKNINEARLNHLATLNLPLEGKRVLEVGAGIGLHTHFFEEQECKITSTDGRRENVDAMRKNFPNRDIRLFNLLDFDSYSGFEQFDVIYCYGTLYHTPKPKEILEGLSFLCREMILLETCVSIGTHLSSHLVRESDSFDQAIGTIGCRPTRPWLMDVLKNCYGYAYATKTQPRHPDFDLDWQIPLKKQNRRAVFVGSKQPIKNPLLLTELPDFQDYA